MHTHVHMHPTPTTILTHTLPLEYASHTHTNTHVHMRVQGLYRGFTISCVGIVVYRGLYFGMYDSLKPVLLLGHLEDSFLASFMLGWGITIGAGVWHVRE